MEEQIINNSDNQQNLEQEERLNDLVSDKAIIRGLQSEIRLLKKRHKEELLEKDKEIKKLKKELDELKGQLKSLEDELEYLREFLEKGGFEEKYKETKKELDRLKEKYENTKIEARKNVKSQTEKKVELKKLRLEVYCLTKRIKQYEKTFGTLPKGTQDLQKRVSLGIKGE
jgi:chromosome segregation ATPase